MTTRDVYDRHTRRELDGDLDAILSDYAPDAIVATLTASAQDTTTSARATSARPEIGRGSRLARRADATTELCDSPNQGD